MPRRRSPVPHPADAIIARLVETARKPAAVRLHFYNPDRKQFGWSGILGYDLAVAKMEAYRKKVKWPMWLWEVRLPCG